MLVLTRQPNQSIVIGDDIVVTVLEVRGDQVRIGVRADRSVPVHREEVYAAVVRANQAAASPATSALSALGALRPGKDSRPARPGGTRGGAPPAAPTAAPTAAPRPTPAPGPAAAVDPE